MTSRQSAIGFADFLPIGARRSFALSRAKMGSSRSLLVSRAERFALPVVRRVWRRPSSAPHTEQKADADQRAKTNKDKG